MHIVHICTLIIKKPLAIKIFYSYSEHPLEPTPKSTLPMAKVLTKVFLVIFPILVTLKTFDRGCFFFFAVIHGYVEYNALWDSLRIMLQVSPSLGMYIFLLKS